MTDRARINRKTFYLHYETLDDLLKEFQDEIIDDFIRQPISHGNIEDIKHIIRYFFETVEKTPKLSEYLFCNENNSQIGWQINKRIMEKRKEQYAGTFSADPHEDSIVFAYFASSSIVLYRQWVRDERAMPLEDLIATATRLICNGMSAYVG